VQTRCSIV